MSLRDRIGYDAGATNLEDSLETARAHGFHCLSFNADTGPNMLASWNEERVDPMRDACHRNGIRLSLHTSSAVNIAEFSPFVSDAVDECLRGCVDLASLLDCNGVVVHGGYHFGSESEARMQASLGRLPRAVGYAEEKSVKSFLENLNFEPDDAEIHYLAHTVEECKYYFEAITSDSLGWAFTVNPSNLVPEGIEGFLDTFGVDRIGEVRLADNLGDKEVHLNPGEGNINFPSVFNRLESLGYQGFYIMAFGSLEDKLRARDTFGGYEQ